MRIRSTKPEFWRSETIASLDWEVRFILKGIEAYVDDNGVGKDSVVLICADVFPHDLARDSETLARVSRGLQKLSEANLIVRYTIAGEPLLYVRRWKSIQRVDKPNKGRYPRPDGTLDYSQPVDESIGPGQSDITPEPADEIREGSGNPREGLANTPEGLAPGTGEQGNRGTEEEQTCSPAPPSSATPTLLAVDTGTETNGYPAEFEEFWSQYPRKAGKRKALTAWKRAMRRADSRTVVAGAIRYAQDPNRDDRYTKYPEGWLNGDGWLDDPLPSRSQPHAVGESKQDAKVRSYLAYASNGPVGHPAPKELL